MRKHQVIIKDLFDAYKTTSDISVEQSDAEADYEHMTNKLMLEVHVDIRDQLKRIADHLEHLVEDGVSCFTQEVV